MQQLLEERLVPHVVLLVQPERLEEVMSLGFVVGVERLDPLLRGRDHVGRGPARELDAGPVADAVDRVREVRKQGRDRLPGDRHRLLQRSPLGGEPEDPAVGVVAIRVADVVLHVADDHVVPVGHVEGAVRTDDGVGRPEVAVLTLQQGPRGRAPDLAELPLRPRLRLAVLVRAGDFRLGRHLRVGLAVAIEVVLLHSQEPDRVADQEVLLHVVGEVR